MHRKANRSTQGMGQRGADTACEYSTARTKKWVHEAYVLEVPPENEDHTRRRPSNHARSELLKERPSVFNTNEHRK